ncbi:hypothetical protein FB451DRAFT_1569597 [Mycena latifolia]|nr:hypothetical protein FB451DRAFT_1569597 [Mycena latifolia]
MRAQNILLGTPDAFTLLTLGSPAHPCWTVPPPTHLGLTRTQRASLLGALEVNVETVVVVDARPHQGLTALVLDAHGRMNGTRSLPLTSAAHLPTPALPSSPRTYDDSRTPIFSCQQHFSSGIDFISSDSRLCTVPHQRTDAAAHIVRSALAGEILAFAFTNDWHRRLCIER